jgi:hypothetical protein
VTLATIEDDEESQRRGVVGLLYFVGENTVEFDQAIHSKLPKLLEWLPCKVAGFHLCTAASILGAFKSFLVAKMGSALRVRLRIHDGTSRRKNNVPKENRRLTFLFLL